MVSRISNVLKAGLATAVGVATVVGLDRLPDTEASDEPVTVPHHGRRLPHPMDRYMGHPGLSHIEISARDYLLTNGAYFPDDVVYNVERLQRGEDILQKEKMGERIASGKENAIIIHRLRSESLESIYRSMYPGIELTNWWHDRSILGQVEVLLREARRNPLAVYRKESLIKK